MLEDGIGDDGWRVPHGDVSKTFERYPFSVGKLCSQVVIVARPAKNAVLSSVEDLNGTGDRTEFEGFVLSQQPQDIGDNGASLHSAEHRQSRLRWDLSAIADHVTQGKSPKEGMTGHKRQLAIEATCQRVASSKEAPDLPLLFRPALPAEGRADARDGARSSSGRHF